MMLYLKLALDGIRKNRRLYAPYILIGSVMVMMHYILAALSSTPMLRQFRGGGFLRTMLPLGVWVIAAFAVVFLFYCSNFIIRQRNRELGLFSVLGMSRKNLSLLMLTENLLTAGASIAIGLLLGIALEKLAEAGMVRLIAEEVSYELRIDGIALLKTIAIFTAIYLLIMLWTMVKVWHTDPVHLLQSASEGEKTPKANWFLGLAGIVLLIWAYYMAATIQQPMEAILTFFRAVLMVIIATYLLFIAGSVLLCRLLQRNKRYYYKPNHFISVATMVYRMKRNGAGLASICILLTVVLVMLSSTLSLCIGAEDAILTTYPHDVLIETHIPSREQMTEENYAARRALLRELAPEQVNVQEYVRGSVSGMFTEDGIIIDAGALEDLSMVVMENIGMVYIVSQQDFEQLTGRTYTLAADECLLLTSRMDYAAPTFTLQGGAPLRVQAVMPDEWQLGADALNMFPALTLVTPDFAGVTAHLAIDDNNYASGMEMLLAWCYAFDVPGGAESQLALYDPLMNHVRDLSFLRRHGGYSFSLSIREMKRVGFYGMYGGLFFIGIMLSIVFIAAAVLIIYYKQVSEGYEDQKRFAIMQKVGMTKREIRRSINSQVLTVFFAPLLLAGLHLTFAFPLMWKLLMMLNFSNMPLMIVVTACSFAVFGVMYAVVYKVTSNAYFAIVSGTQKHT